MNIYIMVNKNIYANNIYLTGIYFRQDRTFGHKCQMKRLYFSQFIAVKMKLKYM